MATKCVIGVFALLVISAQITHGERERQFRRVRSPSPFGSLLSDAGFVNYEKNLPAGRAGGPKKLPGLDETKRLQEVAKLPNLDDTKKLPEVGKLPGGGTKDLPDADVSDLAGRTAAGNQYPDYSTYADMADVGGIGKKFPTHGLDAVHKTVAANGYGYGSGYADNVKSTVYRTTQLEEAGREAEEVREAAASFEDSVEAIVPGKTGFLNGRDALKESSTAFPGYCTTSDKIKSLTLDFKFEERRYFGVAGDRAELVYLKKIFTNDSNACLKSDEKPQIELTVSKDGSVHTLHGFKGKSIRITCSEDNRAKKGFLCLGKEGSGVALTPHPVHTDGKSYVCIFRCSADGRQGYTLFSTTKTPLTSAEESRFLNFIGSAGFNSKQAYFEDFDE